MEKIWKIKKTKNFPPELAAHHSPVILQILANRGLVEKSDVENFFNFSYEKDVFDPFLFLEMEKAAERIMSAKETGENVAIFGDYDADGITASVLLAETLENLGFEKIICYIPDRQNEGYGMNEKSLEYLSGRGIKLIITVDCGISNVRETEKARELGMDVVITDHHQPLKESPAAAAIINPHLENSGYPFPDLSGVGVAFKLAQALYKKISPEKTEQLKWALDLVAIGTIADCVPLLGENRVLTRYGMLVLSKTRRAGILEIMKVGRIIVTEKEIFDTQKISFQISPRINAAGRMDHGSLAYDLIKEKDPVSARVMALEIESKNQERQKITAEIVREVRALAENKINGKGFIFAGSPHWPIGLLGLVAGKIADEFRKPTAIFSEKGDEFTGSFRSGSEINLMEILKECSEFFDKFGGHAQAAGVRMNRKNFERFREKFSEMIEKKTNGQEISPELDVDAEIKSRDIDWDLAEEIKKMEPFGTGNEEPVFAVSGMKIVEAKTVGNGSKHLKLSLRPSDGSPKIFDAIGFGMGESFSNLKTDAIMDLAFNLRPDEWNGNKKIQLRIIDIRPKRS